jgi:hypothetical protein
MEVSRTRTAATATASKRTDSLFSVDNLSFQWIMDHGRLLDIAVIENTAAAEVALDPIRARLLAELAQPKSATMLGQTFGLPR